jgi:chromosome segregation ATPase
MKSSKKQSQEGARIDSAGELAKARRRLDDVKGQRTQLVARQAELDRQIGSAQQQIGRKYLDGDRSGIRAVAELRSELEAISAALVLLDEDEQLIALDVERARALDLRRQASEKKVQLEELNGKTAKLLLELAKLEDVEFFTHSILSAQPLPGAWLQHATVKPPLDYQGIPELMLNIPASERKIAVPLSRRLRKEVEDLELEATIIEQKLAAVSPVQAEAVA